MSQGYFLTVDAGTGSARAIIFDTQGNQVAIAQEEWTHISEEGVLNSMGFDTKTGWEIVSRCIRGAITQAGVHGSEILAVSATSMREGIVLYDQDGNELWGVANVDARADKEVAWINENYPELEREFYNESGQTFALGALPRLLWVKNNRPEIYEKTAKISMISDWVLARLSGEIATDPSNGGTTGVFSLEKRQWETSMASKLGLKDDIFPPVVETGEAMGQVTFQAANETNLNTGTLVVMGGGDVQLGAAGLGVVNVGDSAILGGSFWQQIVNIDGAKVDPNMNIRINPHVIKGQSQAEGITFFSGLIMRWFRDTFAQEEVRLAEQKGIDSYTLLERLAACVPVGSNGILPIFSDVMKYGKWYHAAPSFLNLPLDPNLSSKGALFRSLEENAAIVSMLNLKNILAFTQTTPEFITFAGGASKGELWTQIVADVTGHVIKVPKVTEATALGGAFASGVGFGLYDSIASVAKELTTFEKVIEPNMQNHKLYVDIALQWQKAYNAQLQLVDDNITTSMWKAPGL
jgi:autoinducer 2 (AI-2) kinase